MNTVKLRRIGDEVLLVLPEEWVRETGLGEGDQVVMRMADGELIVSTSDDRHELLMRYAREGMDEYKEALAELAK